MAVIFELLSGLVLFYVKILEDNVSKGKELSFIDDFCFCLSFLQAVVQTMASVQLSSKEASFRLVLARSHLVAT